MRVASAIRCSAMLGDVPWGRRRVDLPFLPRRGDVRVTRALVARLAHEAPHEALETGH